MNHAGNDVFIYKANDGAADSAPATVAITVRPGASMNFLPIVTQLAAPVNPRRVQTLVTASAQFTDQNAEDTHTAVWLWGDGATTAGTVLEQNGAGSVNGQHAYAAPGMYTLKLRVTDNQGGSGEATYQFIIVYDPQGGFVTGGGWVVSPKGACQLTSACQAAAGKANFSFVSKYQKGATVTVPTGETQFDFKAGALSFNSTNQQWLVVDELRVQLSGEGTINGRGRYGFLLSAFDGQPGGRARADLLRIKIWDKGARDRVVYDNEMGAPDDANPTPAIGGGSIVVHD